ncbi:MAG TPA: hypothetical protein VKV15_20895 [Bryobacteraceae bacterium]|nr:hypothetical protein [Bryobacteraceae bacterium]
MRNEEFFAKAREIGPAIWLLTAYWAPCRPDEWPWFLVNDGEPLADEEFASYLNVSAYTIERWRKRLIRAGIVHAKRSTSPRIRQLQDELGMTFKGAYRIRVQRPRLAVALLCTLEEHAQTKGWDAPLATPTIQ